MKQYILNDIELDPNKQFQIKDQVYPAGWLLTAPEKDILNIGIIINNLPDPEPLPPSVNSIVNGLDFIRRLTSVEYSTILLTADNLLKSIPSNPQLSIWLDMVRLNGQIDVNSEDAIAAKNFLIKNSLITEDRANIIFAAN